MFVLTQETLREILHYDPVTGAWTWVKPASYNVEIGQAAGTVSFHGYRIITIDRKKYRSARLAHLYMTGSWPVFEADHENRCKLDDRWENIRDLSRSENALNRDLQSNNASGTRGVHWDNVRSKWFVQIKKDNVTYFVGRYDDFDEAVVARDTASAELHGDFAVLNSERNTA